MWEKRGYQQRITELKERPKSKVARSRYNECQFTAKQLEKFSRLYPTSTNTTLMLLFGISNSTVYRTAVRLGLKKDLKLVRHKISLNANKKRKELYDKEKRRKELGLTQKTNFNLPQFNYTDAQGQCRYRMRKKGYILGDYREDFGERYTLYWSSQTNRSRRMESNAINIGFTIKELID